MQLVGGKTNDKLKAQITRRFRIRSLVAFDRDTQTVHPACSYRFATAKELRQTLANLARYPLQRTVHL